MKMMKNQKPIEIDAYLKYKCPNIECDYDHWISLKESQTKNYKVVCDVCNTVFKPKRISHLKTIYNKKPQNNKIYCELKISKCLNMLCSLGYDNKKAKKILIAISKRNPHIDNNQLFKETILKLEN